MSQQFFDKPVDVIECLTFDIVVDSLITESCDAAIMALENSIAGSIELSRRKFKTYLKIKSSSKIDELSFIIC